MSENKIEGSATKSSEYDNAARKKYLSKLDEAIAEAEMKIPRLQEESQHLKKQLNVKSEELCEKEVVLKVLKIREKIMLEQEQKLEKENIELEKEMRDLQKQCILETGKFCELMSKFREQYKRKGVSMAQKVNTTEDILGFDLSCLFPKQETNLPSPPITDSTEDDSGSCEMFVNKGDSKEYLDEMSKDILETSFDMDI